MWEKHVGKSVRGKLCLSLPGRGSTWSWVVIFWLGYFSCKVLTSSSVKMYKISRYNIDFFQFWSILKYQSIFVDVCASHVFRHVMSCILGAKCERWSISYTDLFITEWKTALFWLVKFRKLYRRHLGRVVLHFVFPLRNSTSLCRYTMSNTMLLARNAYTLPYNNKSQKFAEGSDRFSAQLHDVSRRTLVITRLPPRY